jgi:signal transduction histidine kinase
MQFVATITLGLAFFALGTAAFHLWLFWMRPRDPAHLWLGVASIGIVWLSAGLAASYDARSLAEAQSAPLLALGGVLPFVAGFIRFSELFAGIRHWLLRAAIVETALIIGVLCADPALVFDGTAREVFRFGSRLVYAGLSPFAWIVYASFGLVIAWLVAAYTARARQLEGGRAIAATIGLFGICMVSDMCVGLGLYWAPWLSPLGFVAFGTTFSSLLLRRLVLSQRQVERSAGELHALVEARTDALRRKDLELAHGARLATLGALAGGIAHEVEGPLAEVDGKVKELRNAWRDESRPRAFGDLLAGAQRSVEHIRSVVDELLQLARREEGRSGNYELAAVVAGVLPIAGYELRRRARLETHLASTPLVRGDSAMLSQIALNLLVGAIHAFPDAPAAPTALVHVSTEERGGRACLIVSDNVPAPPSEVAAHLFELPAVSDGELERRLQLAVTKQLVERHGGTLEIASGPQGTRVRVELPAAETVGAAA